MIHHFLNESKKMRPKINLFVSWLLGNFCTWRVLGDVTLPGAKFRFYRVLYQLIFLLVHNWNLIKLLCLEYFVVNICWCYFSSLLELPFGILYHSLVQHGVSLVKKWTGERFQTDPEIDLSDFENEISKPVANLFIYAIVDNVMDFGKVEYPLNSAHILHLQMPKMMNDVSKSFHYLR